MKVEKLNSDLAKELLIVLSFCDEDFISKIPNKIISELTQLSMDSEKKIYIDKEKGLDDENISDDCKDILGLLYYFYILNKEEKEKLLDIWFRNESSM